jgi:ribokinase
MNPLALPVAQRRYDIMVGTGGIGSGSFFQLNGDHTLGREESRSGRFLKKNDYCKLHIIAHYVKALLGETFRVVPVGKVGQDAVGRRLLEEMREAGLETSLVDVDPEKPTLFSFCFLYPDKSGGNMTTDDSASAAVDAALVRKAVSEFAGHAGRGIALAAPEVDIAARLALLELGTAHRFFRVASFTSEEMSAVVRDGVLRQVDLLCVNLDEAAAGAGTAVHGREPEDIVHRAIEGLAGVNPALLLSITNGSSGSSFWDGTVLSHIPACSVPVESSAGAGDAFTAGMIAGAVAGVPWRSAQELASLAAACSVTSPHTINKDMDRTALLEIARQNAMTVSPHARALLEDQR